MPRNAPDGRAVILALDASTSTVVLGLADARTRNVLAERKLRNGRGDVLPGLLEECLTEIGAKASDITSVVCGVGPGSFTGIRIALAFGHGIAFRRNLPFTGVSSLCVAATSAEKVIVLDALRGEAYMRPGVEGEDARWPLDTLSEILYGHLTVAEGRPDFLARMPRGYDNLSAHMNVSGLLAAVKYSATDPVPNYLRASAPEELREERKGR